MRMPKHFPSARVIELANPQSEEASVMRSSLVPGMLNMLAYNLNRGSGNVRLFEAGNVFQMAQGTSKETEADLSGCHWKRVVTAGVHQPARALILLRSQGRCGRHAARLPVQLASI